MWVSCTGQTARPGSVTLHPAAQKKADCPVPGVSQEVGSSSSLPGRLGKHPRHFSSFSLPPCPCLELPVLLVQGRNVANSWRGTTGEVGVLDKSCPGFPGRELAHSLLTLLGFFQR